MAVDIATLALRVDALEVANADKKLDQLARTGKTAENSAKSMTGAFKALAGVLATIKVADMVRDAAMMAARYETMGVVMQVVGNNAGYTGEQMESAAKKLQDYGIAMLESRDITTRLVQAQIDLSKATDLARVAQDAAVIGNVNSSEAFSRMVQGIQSAEVEILRGIGLNVNFENSYKRLATQLGKSKDALTEQEKMTARVNEVMLVGARNAGVYEASMGTAGKMMNSLKRYNDNLKVSLGEAFGPAITHLVENLTAAMKTLNSGVADGKSEIQLWGQYFLKTIIIVEGALQAILNKIYKVGKGLSYMANAGSGAFDTIKNIPGSVGAMFKAMADPFASYQDTAQVSGFTKMTAGWENFWQGMEDAGNDHLKSLEKQMDDLGKLPSSQKRPDKLTVGTTGTTPTVDDKAAKAAAKAASQYADEVERTLDRLLPLRAATQDYAESLGYLNSALSTGTITKDQYGTALEALNREMEDAKKQANAYAQAMKDAERATQESALTINGTKIEIAIAQGQLSANDALPFQVDLLEQRLALQKETLADLKKSTPEEITAWNSQAEAIAQTTLQLAQYQQTLRLQDPYQGVIQGFKDIAEEAKITGQDINDYMVGAFERLNDALVNFLVDGDSFGDVFNSLSKEMLSMTTKSLITGPLFGGIGGMLGLEGAGSFGAGGNVSITAPAMVSINGGLSGTGGILDSLFPNSSEFGESWFGGFFNSGSSQGTNWWDSFYDAGASALSSIAGLFSGGGSGGSSGVNYTAIAMAAASAFESGGIMTSAGPLPLKSYASGGIANSPQLALFGEGRMNEAYVPLPDGKSIPVSMNGGGDGETKALLRELIGAVKAGGSTKIVNAFDAETVANAMSGNSGNKVMLNHVRSNPSAYRAALGV